MDILQQTSNTKNNGLNLGQRPRQIKGIRLVRRMAFGLESWIIYHDDTIVAEFLSYQAASLRAAQLIFDLAQL